MLEKNNILSCLSHFCFCHLHQTQPSTDQFHLILFPNLPVYVLQSCQDDMPQTLSPSPGMISPVSFPGTSCTWQTLGSFETQPWHHFFRASSWSYVVTQALLPLCSYGTSCIPENSTVHVVIISPLPMFKDNI